MATTNYVKFMRGSAEAYQKKVNAGTIDNDTLYFIYDSKDALTGQLYLGNKMLTSGSGDISGASISELKDIVISEVGDRQLLIYDAASEKWVNSSIENAIGVMVGASATTDGDEGLVPQPKVGDEKKFLRGDGTWADQFISSIGDDFQVVDGALKIADDKYLVSESDKKKLNDLVIDEDGKVAVSGTISAANVEGLDELFEEKADAEEVAKLSTLVGDLNKFINGETDEESGESTEGISDILSKMSTSVGNINDLINYNPEEPKSLVDSINDLYKLLEWGDLELEDLDDSNS